MFYTMNLSDLGSKILKCYICIEIFFLLSVFLEQYGITAVYMALVVCWVSHTTERMSRWEDGGRLYADTVSFEIRGLGTYILVVSYLCQCGLCSVFLWLSAILGRVKNIP